MNEKIDFTLASSVKKTQIAVKDLKIGMHVVDLDRPWLETPFLFQGFEIKNEADLKAIRGVCQYVYVDVSQHNKETYTKTAYPNSWLEKTKPPARSRTFEQEFEKAEHAYHGASNLIMEFMDDVRLGRTVNYEIAKKAVSYCVDSVLHQPDALMWMTQLKSRDQYTAQHSMNVCVLSIALARQINLSVDELNQVGLCGMMHDMGKMRVPLDILNKPDKLEPNELSIMQSHTTLGWKMLMSSRNMYEGAIDVAYSHHERLDGVGYPRKLNDPQITAYTRIVAIADMYDAITSDRIYKDGKTHLEAINILTKAGGGHLDPSLVIKFIECIGIYPPGSVVEMNNGEIAVVVEVNPSHKIRPKIITLLDEDGNRKEERVVDLAKLDLDASGHEYRIKKIVKPSDFGIDLKDLYQKGFLDRGFSAVAL
ncbi:MAG: HD-GYP domain-containing protein [Gammaproteobacteria bacterium]